MVNPNKAVSFDDVITALLDLNKPFPPTYLHRFSDLEPAELNMLKATWERVDPKRRIALMEDLEDLEDNDTLVLFDELCKWVLKDNEAVVRACAIRMLWDCEDVKLIPQLIDIMLHDQEPVVRAEAAGGLGAFVYRGELAEIPTDRLKMVEDHLLDVLAGKDEAIVRRAALESIGFSGRPEAVEWVQTSYELKDTRWQSSALIAMGRSADNRWEKSVLRKLVSSDGQIKEEAVRAAGLLEIASARPILMEMLSDAEELDLDIRMAAIWSLSQIGGEGVSDLLDHLHETSMDDDEASFIEEALDNLEFTEGLPNLNLLEISDTDDEDLDTIINLDEDQEDEDLEDI